MPTLPKSLGVVRAAVASALLHPQHAGRLYGATDLAIILNIAVDVGGNVAVSVRVNASASRVRTRDARPSAAMLGSGGSRQPCRPLSCRRVPATAFLDAALRIAFLLTALLSGVFFGDLLRRDLPVRTHRC